MRRLYVRLRREYAAKYRDHKAALAEWSLQKKEKVEVANARLVMTTGSMAGAYAIGALMTMQAPKLLPFDPRVPEDELVDAIQESMAKEAELTIALLSLGIVHQDRLGADMGRVPQRATGPSKPTGGAVAARASPGRGSSASLHHDPWQQLTSSTRRQTAKFKPADKAKEDREAVLALHKTLLGHMDENMSGIQAAMQYKRQSVCHVEVPRGPRMKSSIARRSSVTQVDLDAATAATKEAYHALTRARRRSMDLGVDVAAAMAAAAKAATDANPGGDADLNPTPTAAKEDEDRNPSLAALAAQLAAGPQPQPPAWKSPEPRRGHGTHRRLRSGGSSVGGGADENPASDAAIGGGLPPRHRLRRPRAALL